MQSDRIPNQFSKVSITKIDDPETTSWRLDSQVGRITDAPLIFFSKTNRRILWCPLTAPDLGTGVL